MKKNIRIIFLLCLISANSFSQSFNYKFCLLQKDATTIALEFTVCNNTTAPISTFTFVFDWPGVSNVTVDNGLVVIQNGNNGVVEFQQQAWGPALTPGCNNKFTVRMNYVLGMFPSTTGILNGAAIPGITCYVPPSLENFKCKKDFNKLCFLNTDTEIKIGEGTVYAWGSTRDVYIPTNRKGWAIGMAVAHTMFTNLMGFDCLTINEYFATTMQETNCGCDVAVTAPAWVTNTYPDQSAYCFNKNVAVGFFQQELQSGWVELTDDIPCFIPTIDVDKFVVGAKFETQAIAKVYQDFNNIAYWQYIKCWNPIGFLKNAKDPYATEKLIAFGYNRGMNAGAIGTLLTTDRTVAMAATNILPYLSPTGVGWVYAEQISRLSAVLDNNFASVNPADAAANSVTFPGVHSFRGYYDTPISWADISDYIDVVAPMYVGVGLNAVSFKSTVQKVFNNVNGGSNLSFRYQLAPVIDAIVLNLPAFDSKFGLGKKYMNSGGQNCKFPTASMSKSDTVCPGIPLVLTVKLTGTPPWSFSYKDAKGNAVTLNNIITSPYTFTVADTGTYQLISVLDNSGDAGEIICEPVIKAYSTKGASADLKIISSTPCGPKGVQIQFTGTGPFSIEYTKDGAVQTPINNITQNPYTLISSPAPVGTYVLTRLLVNGCDILLKDTVIVSATTNLTMSISGNTTICSGQSTTLTAHGATAYTWANGLGSDSVVSVTPTVSTTYTIYGTSGSNCSGSASVKVTVNKLPNITAGPDTVICLFSNVLLYASGGSTYTWTPSADLSSATTASVIATPTITTAYIVTATDANGCSAKDTVRVGVITCSGITATVTGGTICKGSCFDLKVNGVGGISPYTYYWAGGQTTQKITVCPTVTTTFSVLVTDQNGLTANATAVVFVSPSLVINMSKTNVLCNGTKSGTATALPIGGNAPYTYLWSPSVGTSSAVTGLSAGSYSVSITDANGCSQVAALTIGEPSAISLLTNSTQTGCKINNGTATVNSSNGIAPYTYKWNSGQTTSIVTALGIGSYTVLVTDANGCTRTQTVSVTQTPGPTVSASTSSNVISLGARATLTATGGGTYSWSPVSGLSCNTCANTTAAPEQTTSYCVVVTDGNACTAYTCITIMVDIPCGNLYVPNAFSPNNDMENDMECVMGGCIESMYIAIFNRWGEKVFESSDQKTCWDGTYQGKLLDSEVYNYYMNVTFTSGEKVNKKGNISLIR